MKEFKKFSEEEWYKHWEEDEILDCLVDEVQTNLMGNSVDYQTFILQNFLNSFIFYTSLS